MNKEIAKKYLLSLALLYGVGAVLLTAFLFAVSRSAAVQTSLTLGQCAALGCLCALAPAGAYTGAVHYGLKLKTLSKKQIVLLAVWLPLVLAFVLVAGIFLILPTTVNAVKILNIKT